MVIHILNMGSRHSVNHSINGEQREPTASPSQSHASGRSRRPLPPTPGSSSSGPPPKPPIMNFDNGSKASHESYVSFQSCVSPSHTSQGTATLHEWTSIPSLNAHARPLRDFQPVDVGELPSGQYPITLDAIRCTGRTLTIVY